MLECTRKVIASYATFDDACNWTILPAWHIKTTRQMMDEETLHFKSHVHLFHVMTKLDRDQYTVANRMTSVRQGSGDGLGTLVPVQLDHYQKINIT